MIAIYKRGFWNSMTIRSLAIGQGEIMVTPLQLANFTATVANRGYYYPPHLLDSIEDKEEIRKPFMERHYTLAEPVNFEPVIEGMHRVFTADHGTAQVV
ncbi:MAG: penicillin-binding transpeptidase domain-containing protein [Bacteroidales bacterium]|nr:penicillin-binding transpeptidase domain-containing protein [Bacteroidales bacterium]